MRDAVILLALVAAGLSGCSASSTPPDVPGERARKLWPVPPEASARENPVAGADESVREGAQLFQDTCAMCHGEKGDGDSPYQEMTPDPLPDFTDAAVMRRQTDGDVFYKISVGRDLMTPFEGTYTEEQRWHLVNYIRSLAKE